MSHRYLHGKMQEVVMEKQYWEHGWAWWCEWEKGEKAVPMPWATIPSVQRTLWYISLFLLINTPEKIKSPVLRKSRNQGILKALIARNSQPVQYTAWRVSTRISSAST